MPSISWIALLNLVPTIASLRYFRTCIRINNHFVIRHLIKHECFAPILDLAAEEAGRDNLVSASCQEFFENIRKVSFQWLLSIFLSFSVADTKHGSTA